MQQVLFRIPDPTGNFPDGFPVYGYGMMLFVTFLICSWFAARHSRRAGLPKERLWDLAIWVFVWGIVGGRLTYMIQYRQPLVKFFNLWEGGLVIYGALIFGFVAYWAFYLYVRRTHNYSSWRLADVVAPTICIGLALGRIGCLLNGCCYGGVAGEGCPALEFPLLTAPAREAVVEGAIGKDRYQYQTLVGFTTRERDPKDDDIRTVVGKIEPGSAAEKSGLKGGDRIVTVNGRPNGGVLIVSDAPNIVERVVKEATGQKFTVEELPTVVQAEKTIKVFAPDPESFDAFRDVAKKLAPTARFYATDSFSDLLQHWPRGRTSLELIVERSGQLVTLPSFTPRSIGLHPTQLYETISMLLLLVLLLAYYPYRRHNGQLFVLFMMGYAVHRFLNETIRDDTPSEYWFGMTLSQTISVLVFSAALVLEIWLRWIQPKRTVRGVDEYAGEPEPTVTKTKP